MTIDNVIPSQTVLEETPGRALQFLRGVAQNNIVHGQLAAAGFTPDEYTHGWKLLHEAAGYKPAEPAPNAPVRSPAFVAMEQLDAWDEDGFRRVRAALERLHPDQATFVFADDLAASTGPAAVLGVKTLLARLDDLENGPQRKTTRKQDHAALDTLANRGIIKEERIRLKELVHAAQTVETPIDVTVSSAPAERPQALVDLYAWYRDWADTAHSVIKKRAHLITLGLAKRRAPKKNDSPAPKE
jgi:hypothetical protein